MHRLILALILVAGFALRVWNNDYGLPFVYSVDEASHFTDRAVQMFREGLDPGYYQNPAAYTYLVHLLLRVLYGPLGFLFDLPFGNVTEQFDKDPGEMWIAARTLAALLCMGGVLTVYAAAKRLWGVREGLVAAALLAFAFLTVAYSRVAVTDVGSLIGVSLAVLFAVRAHEEDRRRDWVLAGAAVGLAAAFKYTAGLAALPLLVAALARPSLRRAAGLALAGLAALVVFVLLNPYLFTSPGDWWTDLRDQADVAANDPKPGQESGGLAYYLDSLTWGLGWAGLAAALAGAALLLVRDLVRALILISVPLALFAYLAVQSRYFGRWLLPAYPALALLGAYAIARAAELLPDRAPLRAGAAAALTLLVLAQPLAGRRSQRPGARARGHAQPGARVSGRTLRSRRCAFRSSPPSPGATSAPIRREPRRHGSPAAPSARAGPSRVGPTRPRTGAAYARSTSRASSCARTAACVPRPTGRCSAPRSSTTCACTATAT